jgi:hypothetical protein
MSQLVLIGAGIMDVQLGMEEFGSLVLGLSIVVIAQAIIHTQGLSLALLGMALKKSLLAILVGIYLEN